MITLIIGQNAIGKSVYLKDKLKKEISSDDILCNFIDGSYLRTKRYNSNRIEELKELLDTDNIITNKDKLGIETDVLSISTEFENILTLICKEGDRLYIDEPEFGLSYKEIGRLIAFIAIIEDTFKDIEVITHSEMFLGLNNANIKTIKYDMDTRSFIAIDLEDTAYETID